MLPEVLELKMRGTFVNNSYPSAQHPSEEKQIGVNSLPVLHASIPPFAEESLREVVLKRDLSLSADAATALIARGEEERVLYNLDRFPSENNKILRDLLAAGYSENISWQLDSFHPLNNESASILLAYNKIELLAWNLASFQHLDQRYAELLIDQGFSRQVKDKISSFDINDPTLLALRFAEVGEADYVDVAPIFKEIRLKYQKDNIIKLSNQQSTKKRYFKYSDALLLRSEIKEGLSDFKAIFEKLKTRGIWANDPDLVQAFETLADFIGYRGTFEALARTRKDHSSYLKSLEPLVKFFTQLQHETPQASTTKAKSIKKAFKCLLFELEKDKKLYDSKDTYTEMTNLLRWGVILPARLLDDAKSDQILKNNQNFITKLHQYYESPELFSSWRTFHDYLNLCLTFQHNREKLYTIERLRDRSEHGTLRFFEGLTQESNSRIHMTNVLEFINTPACFLSRDDFHAPEKHDRMKPSNFTACSHLGLSAEELRNALINGSLAKLQFIKPCTFTFQIKEEGKYSEEELKQLGIPELIRLSLGERTKAIQGKLSQKNAKQLAKRLSDIVSDEPEYININPAESLRLILDDKVILSDELSLKIRDDILDAFRRDKLIDEGRILYEVNIFAKGDPASITANEAIASCASFGSGKSIDYLYYPSGVDLSVSRIDTEQQTKRIVANSLIILGLRHSGLTVNQQSELSHDFPELKELCKKDLREPEVQLICDSIEVRHHELKVGDDECFELKQIYEELFFHLNSAIKASIRGASLSEKVAVGGYFPGPFARAYPSALNRTMPLVPIAYIDNNEEFYFEMTAKSQLTLIEQRGLPEAQINLGRANAVSPITHLDTLAVWDCSRRAVALHKLRNNLLAIDIANTHRENPNFSFKYLNSNSEMTAYLIAYRGINSNNNRPCIYLADFFYEEEDKADAAALLQNFITQYDKLFSDTEDAPEIYTNSTINRKVEEFKTGLKVSTIG